MKNVKIQILSIGFCLVAMATLGIGSSTSSNVLRVSETNAPKSKQIAQQLVVTGLKSDNMKQREKAAEAIRNERTEIIKQLIEFASENVEPLPSSDSRFIEYPWHDLKHLSILLLGDLRAIEAIPVLLDNLEYKNPRKRAVPELLNKDGWYPAVEALSKIGMPAVEPTIRKLSGYEPNSKGSELCCWILKKILGVRLARLRLQIAIEETRDKGAKKNLTVALPYFKTDREKAEEERAHREKADR